MGINLSKGGQINLTKGNNVLTRINMGLGWDPAKGMTIDCDAYTFPVLNNGVIDHNNIIYFGKGQDNYGVMRYSGDDLTGAGSAGGDDEVITIDLTRIPPNWDKIVCGMNIYNANFKRQNFNDLDNCYIRLVDATNNYEFCRYALGRQSYGSNANSFINNMKEATAIVFAVLYRNNGYWTFKTVGEYVDADKPTKFANEVNRLLRQGLL